ncbi:IclR family transcriptional regulator [Neorhizobium sp. DAR64861/K0K2]|uniref:IclR family transcriptional regulator n=1 Tax=unclassified Neorhizobium TaxID=2629175 RepID=UPI003D2BE91C
MDTTFVKGLTLIELLAKSDEPRGVTSLARELDLTKSNVHRLLTTLVATGYVRRDDANASYELSSKVWEIGLKVGSRFNLAKIARPRMTQLAELTGESVHLSVLDMAEVVYMDKIESLQPIRSYTSVGGRAPAWCVATGKAMLAQLPPESLRLPQPLTAFTDQTITDSDALAAEFSTIRKQGYAVNRGEWRDGVFGIASAISDATGRVVGAIGISGPGTRFKPREIKSWGAMVVEAAQAVSRSVGGSGRGI